VTEATKSALRIFCTRNHAPPFAQPEHKGVFDEALYDHVRQHLRALTVDSAGNEVAAGENMSVATSVTAHVPGEAAIDCVA